MSNKDTETMVNRIQRKDMIKLKVDKRRHYILVVDTETANTVTTEKGGIDMSNTLVYDCGWMVIDTRGNIYESRSFINRDIFVYERELMESAYYGWKIPIYVSDIQGGSRKMADIWEIRKAMLEDMEAYGITEICAHNARFDVNALNNTIRYVTKSRKRYWFPFGTIIWDSLKMARSVMGRMPMYNDFCINNGYVTKTGKIRFTAEICYRFIIQDNEFEESHTGLEDVTIEKEIIRYCYRQKKAMKKLLYENAKEFPQQTDFQIALLTSLKKVSVI